MSLLAERFLPWILAVVCSLLAWRFRVDLPAVGRLHDLFGSVITLAGVAVGFLLTTKTILLSIGDRWIIRRAKEAGAYSLLVEYLIDATKVCFAVAVITPLWLIAGPDTVPYGFDIFLSCWIGLVFAGISATYRVLRILFQVMRAVGDSDDEG